MLKLVDLRDGLRLQSLLSLQQSHSSSKDPLPSDTEILSQPFCRSPREFRCTQRPVLEMEKMFNYVFASRREPPSLTTLPFLEETLSQKQGR